MRKLLRFITLVIVMVLGTNSVKAAVTITADGDDGVIVKADNEGELQSYNPTDAEKELLSRSTLKLQGKFKADDLTKFRDWGKNIASVVDFSEATFGDEQVYWPIQGFVSCQTFTYWGSNLTTAILSPTATTYKSDMFQNCNNLTSVKYKEIDVLVNGNNASFTKSGNDDDDNFLKALLEANGKTVTIEEPAQETSWDGSTGTLTLSEADGTPENLPTIVASSEYSNGADNVNKVIFADGSVWERSTGVLTATDNGDAHKAALEAAGLTPVNVETKLGNFVSVKSDGTVVVTTTEEGQLGSQLGNLTPAEKEAVQNATNLKLVGPYMNDPDILSLGSQSKPTSLDLSEASINDSQRLPSDWKICLEEVSLPEDPAFTRVPNNFALEFTNLKGITFPGNISAIGEKAFEKTGIKYLELPGSIRQIDENAFKSCANLETVVQGELGVGNSCTFGNTVFESCSSLKHVTLSEGVTQISNGMFDKCGQLESIRIPSTCSVIKEYAFNACASLHTIVIPEGVQRIEANVFAHSGLAHIYVMATTPDKIPEIVSSGIDTGDYTGTFTGGQLAGQGNDPKNQGGHTNDEMQNATDEDILYWYQDEQSNPGYGLGGGQCIIQLHYPDIEALHQFYDGVNDPINGGTSWANPAGYDRLPSDLLQGKITAGSYLSDGYSVGSEDTWNQGDPYSANQYMKFGPQVVTEDGVAKNYYWPTVSDFMMRLAAGYAKTDQYKKVTSQDEIVAGNKYVLVCESNNKAMKTYEDEETTCGEVAVTIRDNYVPYVAGINVFTFEQGENGWYVKQLDDKYLYSSEAGNLQANADNGTLCTISEDFQIVMGDNGILQYNESQFAPSPGTQTPAYLYVLDEHTVTYSRLGWRQIPLQKKTDNDDFTFTKEYDNTWYTMCFPWDMDDNTLFRAFNQSCEIAEFVGVEVVPAYQGADQLETPEFTLVFHFDEVAKTHYLTKNHREDQAEYMRLSLDPADGDRYEDYKVDGQSTTRTVELTVGDSKIKKKYYTYKKMNDGTGEEYIYWPFGLPEKLKDRTPAQKAMCDAYEGIQHLMVYAGHPYMIHPSIGASPGVPAKTTIAGVEKLYSGKQNNNKLQELAELESQKVTFTATVDGKAYHTPGNTAFVNPQTGGSGSYTFIGNINEYDEGETKAEDMTTTENPVAYFLAVENPTKWDEAQQKYVPDPSKLKELYPKFYRKSGGKGAGKWSQYSAIIRPTASGRQHIDNFVKATAKSPSGQNTTQAKSFDVVFGEWELVEATDIKDIIVEAEKKGQKVQKAHLNVVFNVKGQIVREGTPSVEGLPSGMYIVNGKKYIVK